MALKRVTFKPEKAGFFNKDNKITRIRPGSQADKLGMYYTGNLQVATLYFVPKPVVHGDRTLISRDFSSMKSGVRLKADRRGFQCM